MKQFFVFGLIFLLTLSSVSAFFTVDRTRFTGPTFDSRFTFQPIEHRTGSGVYNANRYGLEQGRNPFYLRGYTPGQYRPYNNFRGHIRRNDALSETIYRNPWLLTPRVSTNNQRYLRGFEPGFFAQFGAPNGVTGRIRSDVPGVFS